MMLLIAPVTYAQDINATLNTLARSQEPGVDYPLSDLVPEYYSVIVVPDLTYALEQYGIYISNNSLDLGLEPLTPLADLKPEIVLYNLESSYHFLQHALTDAFHLSGDVDITLLDLETKFDTAMANVLAEIESARQTLAGEGNDVIKQNAVRDAIMVYIDAVTTL